MKLDALDHPKTLDLAARLDVTRPTVLGHLELLWAFTGKKAPQGNIGKWPDGAIARACDWMGDPNVFISALIAAGFLEADETHRLLVHDWHAHVPGWVRSKLSNAGLGFLTVKGDAPPSDPPDDDDSGGASDPPSTRPSRPPIQGKGREEKGSQERKTRARAEANGRFCPEPAERSDDAEHAEWLTVAELYPPGAARVDWLAAEKGARQLVETGAATWDDLRAGVKRYAALVAATNRLVLNPLKFFTDRDRPWSQAWPIPAGASKPAPRIRTATEIAEEYEARERLAGGTA